MSDTFNTENRFIGQTGSDTARQLDNFLRHSSIKECPSAVRSLHADQGFPDHLENHRWLQSY